MFEHAPAPTVVEGLLAVPVHVLGLRARVVLDAHAGAGRVQALLRYRVGPTSGCPVFDLRQPVDRVRLDGRALAPEHVRPRSVGAEPYATVRVLDLPQATGSTHTLGLGYRLARPASDLGGAYPPVLSVRGRRRLRWSFGMGDLFDGRHLEMWLPSNLPFDRFPVELEVVLDGVGTPHTLITNGAMTATGPSSWDVAFPAWFSSVSAMLELWPTDELEHLRRPAPLRGSGRTVPVDLWKVRGRPEDLAHEGTRVARLLEAGETTFGPFPLDRYTCFFHDREGGMEYAGATTTSSGALAHEVLHSWFARGVMPASDADGWWDEAVTTYLTRRAAAAPLDFRRAPVELCSRRPFQRHTALAAYAEGSRLFSGLEALVGRPALLRAMRSFYLTYRRSCVSTATLEEHLVVETGATAVVDAFHRFVYGFEDPRGPGAVRLDEVAVGVEPDGRRWVTVRVRNDHAAEACAHFLVLLSSAGLVRLAAVAGFDLRPGCSRVLRVRLPPGPGPAGTRGEGLDVVGTVHVRRPVGSSPDRVPRTPVRAGRG